MADVWLGRFNRWIEKLFDIKGGPTVVDMSPTIQPVISTQPGVEERVLQSWNRFGMAATAPAVAAATAAVQIRNPVGSGIIAVIERCGFRTGAATLSAIAVSMNSTTTADLPTIITPQRLDARVQPGSNMVESASTGNTAPLNTLINTSVFNGLETQIINTENQEITLLPGDTLRIVDQTVNEILTVTFLWRERSLEPSELT